jgi:predicted permease
MSMPGEILRRLHMLLRRGRFQAELEEEMQLHIELRRQQQMAAGLSPDAARFAARRKFGNATQIQETSHRTWGWDWLESFCQDIGYGTRALLRGPGITVVALTSLALGIGANTAIFSLLDAVMLRSLPVKDPQQLVLLGEAKEGGIGSGLVDTELYSYPFYRRLQEKNSAFSDTAAILSMMNALHGFVDGRTEAEPMNVQLVSGTYFSTLGIQARMGRMLSDDDDKSEGDHPVAVVSYSWWRRDLAGDPAVLDRKLKIGTTIFNIVGVAPSEFFGTVVGQAPDIWVPLSMMKSVPPGWGDYHDISLQFLYLIGRLKPGISPAHATADVNLLYQQITRGFPGADLSQKNLDALARAHIKLTPMATGLSSLRREFSEPLQILMGIVALVLLIACANIANLLLARSTARARELAVRQALGARRTRLIRQLLTESLSLALAGGALGVGFATIATRVLLRMVSGGVETIPLNVGLDLRLLAFTFAVTVLTAVVFGTIPALRATRIQLTDALKDGRSPGSTGARNPLARALVMAQVALSLILLVGAGIFLRSLVNLDHVDPGFNRENVLRLQIDSDSTGYKEERVNQLFQEIESRVGALPGVKAASFSAFTFHEGSWSDDIVVPGMEIDQNEPIIHHNIVGNGYFATMGIPILAGRAFGPQDTATSQHVAIISERLARTMFPPGNPIGRHFRIVDDRPQAPEPDVEVIGVAKDVKFGSLQESKQYINYLPYTQHPWGFGDFEVRYSGDFTAISREVQQTIHSIDHTLPITRVTTLDEQVALTITNERIVAQLSTFFGLLAVFLSCIGIYGLMSYVVSRRTNEIGIRMALGAARFNVSWLVMREILLLVLSGLAIGIPITLAASRLVANMLYGLHGTDPISVAGAVLLLLLVAVCAGYFPARRASKVDPMVALRYE